MILKKAATKVKELVGKLLESGNNLTWKEIIALWLTVAGVSSLLPSLFFFVYNFRNYRVVNPVRSKNHCKHIAHNCSTVDPVKRKPKEKQEEGVLKHSFIFAL